MTITFVAGTVGLTSHLLILMGGMTIVPPILRAEFKTSGNKPKKIKHKILTDRIFEIAKWDTTKKYCSVGYLKEFDECSALIFDISAVKELPLKQDRKTNVENKKPSAKIVKF